MNREQLNELHTTLFLDLRRCELCHEELLQLLADSGSALSLDPAVGNKIITIIMDYSNLFKLVQRKTFWPIEKSQRAHSEFTKSTPDRITGCCCCGSTVS